MHELSLVDELLAVCRERAGGRAVRQIWVRCPATVDAAELADAFALAASGSVAKTSDPWLAGAELKLEPVPVWLECPCGYKGQLEPDHLAGHLAICPSCGHVSDADASLELVSMTFSERVEPFGLA
jgi:Zn finger protein HypA/HybF involved in hydrogenase expression